MKKIVMISVISLGLLSMKVPTTTSTKVVCKSNYNAEKYDIKIKNDTDNVVKTINTGSGGSYSLSKNTVTTIKMEDGDKLHYYDNGKKGALILTASKEMDGKVQLLSKL